MSPRSRRRGGGGGGGGQRGRRRQGQAQRNKQAGAGFWGDASKLPDARPDVRISEDAAAVARSLGPPPLAGQEAIAEHYFSVVYDRAVMLAGAVATAAGLITLDELESVDADD